MPFPFIFPRPAKALAPVLTLAPPVLITAKKPRVDQHLRTHMEAVVPPSRLPPPCDRCAFPTWRSVRSAETKPVPPALTLDACVKNDGLVSGFREYDPPVVYENGRYTLPSYLLTESDSSVYESVPMEIASSVFDSFPTEGPDAAPQPPPLPPRSSTREVSDASLSSNRPNADQEESSCSQTECADLSLDPIVNQALTHAGPERHVSLQVHAPIPIGPARHASVERISENVENGSLESEAFDSRRDYETSINSDFFFALHSPLDTNTDTDTLSGPDQSTSARFEIGEKRPIVPPPTKSLLTLGLKKTVYRWPFSSPVSPLSEYSDNGEEGLGSPVSSLAESMSGPLAQISNMKWQPAMQAQMMSAFESWSSSGDSYYSVE